MKILHESTVRFMATDYSRSPTDSVEIIMNREDAATVWNAVYLCLTKSNNAFSDIPDNVFYKSGSLPNPTIYHEAQDKIIDMLRYSDFKLIDYKRYYFIMDVWNTIRQGKFDNPFQSPRD